MTTKLDVVRAELVIDFGYDEEDFHEVWEELYIPILEKCELWEDSINGLADALTSEEIRFICKSMGIDINFFNSSDENKVFCVYWFIKKLIINNLEGLDYCETVISYLDSLAKLVKNFIFCD